MNNRPVYYKQSDPRWRNMPYTIDGDKHETIGASGCGPTCAAMIIASVRDSKITPVETCKLAIEMKDRTANSGTEWEFFGKIAAMYNIPFKQSGSAKEAIEALKAGAYAICSMKRGKFTRGGHYILAWDFKDNRILVHDPASTALQRTFGDVEIFETQCKKYFIFFVNQQSEQSLLPVLARGMKNENVATLQEQLNKLGYHLNVDGIFGELTENAVKDFQNKRGLVQSGILELETLNKLYEV